MLAKKLKARIGDNKTIVLHVPDMPEGEVEIIILKKENQLIPVDELLAQAPKRRVGKILGTLRREDIYTDVR
jgi:hypothetical protein